MPELPEVEGYRAALEQDLLGRTIERVRVLDRRILDRQSPARLRRLLERRRPHRVDRKGKILFAFTDGPALLAVHFGMTGAVVASAAGESPHRWDRVRLELDDGRAVTVRDMRLFGWVRAIDRTELSELLWRLGPDPLEVRIEWFREALSARRAPIKATLLNQAFLSGIGNMYADEALFRAGIDPARPARSLDDAEAARLLAEIRTVLRIAIRAVAAGRDPRLALFALRQRAARERAGPGLTAVGCPRCGHHLAVATIGGRTTYSCDRCQR